MVGIPARYVKNAPQFLVSRSTRFHSFPLPLAESIERSRGTTWRKSMRWRDPEEYSYSYGKETWKDQEFISYSTVHCLLKRTRLHRRRGVGNWQIEGNETRPGTLLILILPGILYLRFRIQYCIVLYVSMITL